MALEAQNNPFTSVLMVEAADVEALPDADPAAGSQRLAVGTDHLLYLVNSSGTKTQVGGAAGAMATDALWDAAGDLAVGTGANTGAKLTIGAAGTFPKSTGSALAYAIAPTFHGCRVYDGSGAQSIANNTIQAVTMNSESYDTDAYHSTSSNTSRITIPTGLGGYYLVTGEVTMAANATGSRQGIITLNGTGGTRVATSNKEVPHASNNSQLAVVGVYALAAGDYIEMCAFQTSGGALNTVNFSVIEPHFSATLIGV
jgi:hypothetical protein